MDLLSQPTLSSWRKLSIPAESKTLFAISADAKSRNVRSNISWSRFFPFYAHQSRLQLYVKRYPLRLDLIRWMKVSIFSVQSYG
jgi:hypothetical protein